jgi:hypothetical protein
MIHLQLGFFISSHILTAHRPHLLLHASSSARLFMGSHILTAHRPHLLHNLSSYSNQLLSHYLVRLTMSQVASLPDVGGTADTGAAAIRSAAARCALGCTPLSELDQQNGKM